MCMILNKQFTLQTKIPNVVETLRRYVGNIVPYGYVNESAFCIYKSNRNTPKKLAAWFVVSGTISSTNDKVQITMKVRPFLPVFIAAGIFAIALIFGLHTLVFNHGSFMYVVLGVVFNLLFHLNLAWQMWECISGLLKELEN